MPIHGFRAGTSSSLSSTRWSWRPCLSVSVLASDSEIPLGLIEPHVFADLFSAIFDLSNEENGVWYGIVSVVAAVLLTLACQYRSKQLRNK